MVCVGVPQSTLRPAAISAVRFPLESLSDARALHARDDVTPAGERVSHVRMTGVATPQSFVTTPTPDHRHVVVS
jgi:hypothetical protein